MTDSTSTLRDLFETAVALPVAERAAWLLAHCDDPARRAVVERLLAADATGDARALAQPFNDLFAGIGDPEQDAALPPAGSHVGPFKLLEKLGEGGSSIVFRAEREQSGVTQTVALKLLRRGLYLQDEQRRFRDERRALAQLRHPGIARLIEGGVTDAGVPYIALDLIDGEPITVFVRNQTFDLRRRLKLFIDICRAVEAAHRALIVHRDLKPSNVLVTREGEVKLLDFGIAKLLDAGADGDPTRTQQPAMTPAYAAPEQFTRAPITTATDVYSLGILLGELITGARREHGDTRTPSSQVSESTEPGVLPAPPRITRRQLRGDLDNILLKATATEPEHRYASAGALADDIVRHLAGQPVTAHPPSRWYRTRKFVARHRGGVVTAALFLLAIIASLGIALWQANVARDEAQRASSVRDFLVRVFSAAEPAGPRLAPPSVVDVVRASIADAQRSMSLYPAVRIELLETLGRVLGAQGDLDGSVNLLATNHDDATRRFGASHPSTLRAGLALARALTDAGQRPRARSLLNALLQQAERVRDPDLRARLLEASARLGIDRFEKARSLSESAQALALCEHACSEETRILVLLTRGGALAAFQHDEAAIPFLEAALQLQRKRYNGPHVDIAETLQYLSRAHRRLGHFNRAETMARESLAIVEASVPDPHVRRTNALDALRQVLIDSHKLDEAIALGQRIVAMDEATLGPQHPDVATSENTLGFTYGLTGQYANAAVHYRNALAISERVPDNERRSALYRSNLGYAVGNSGDLTAGTRLVRKAINTLRAQHDPDYSELCSALEKLGSLQRMSGDLDAALATFEESDRFYRDKLPDAPKDWRVVTLVGLGRIHMDRHDDVRAASALRLALDNITISATMTMPARIEPRAALAEVLHNEGDDNAARVLLNQAVQEATAANGAFPGTLQQFLDAVSASIP